MSIVTLEENLEKALKNIEDSARNADVYCCVYSGMTSVFRVIQVCKAAKTISILMCTPMDSQITTETGFGRLTPTSKQTVDFIDRRLKSDIDFKKDPISLAGAQVLPDVNLRFYVDFTDTNGKDIVYISRSREKLLVCGDMQSETSPITLSSFIQDEVCSSSSIASKLCIKFRTLNRNIAPQLKSSILKTLALYNVSYDTLITKAFGTIYKSCYLRQVQSPSDDNSIIDFNFQLDGALALMGILNKYNLAYLADSVGLGKTMTIVRLLKLTKLRAVIVCPNEFVQYQWDSLAPTIGNKIYTVINSYQSLSKFSNQGFNCYDIVIFDEAHHFRNAKALRYKTALEVCAGKPVVLVGATPVNNSLNDIVSQLLLGLHPDKAYDFGVGPVRDYLNGLVRQSNGFRDDPEKYKESQRLAGEQIRNRIISKLMVRRTREDIVKYYKSDIDTGKIKFPVIEKPINVEVSYTNYILSTIIDILSGYNAKYPLSWAYYDKDKYLIYKGKHRESDDVENFVENVESDELSDMPISSLAGLGKISLIKILDSSPLAFAWSIRKYNDKVVNAYNRLVNSIDESGCETCLDTETGARYSKVYKELLKEDANTLYHILQVLKDNQHQLGLKLFKLSDILKHRDNTHKVVIFTDYIMTAEWLSDYLSKQGYRCFTVTGSGNSSKLARRDSIETINSNFGTYGILRDNYDILISTNILSEGINLNRVDTIVNFDIPWNPMVVAQRIGRLNRLDTTVDSIKIYNFFPCDELDSQVDSEYNIISKYALACYSVGVDCDCLGRNTTEVYMNNDQGGMLGTTPIYFNEAKVLRESKLDEIDLLKSVACMAVVSIPEGNDLCYQAVFEQAGSLIISEFSKSGFKFISGDEVVSKLLACKNTDISDCTIHDFVNLSKISELTSREYIVNPKLSTSQLGLIKLCDRYIDLLSGEREECGGYGQISLFDPKSSISDVDRFSTLHAIQSVKYSTIHQVITEDLAHIYLQEYNTAIKNLGSDQGIAESARIFVERLSHWAKLSLESMGYNISRKNMSLQMFICYKPEG